jgi:hypothetical protein
MGRISTKQPDQVTREVLSQWESRWPALKALNDATLCMKRGEAIEVEKCHRICGDKEQFKKVASKWKQGILGVLGIMVRFRPKPLPAYEFVSVDYHLGKHHDRTLARAEKMHRSESLKLAMMHDDDLATDHQKRLRLFQRNQHSDAAGKINSLRDYNRIAIERPETMPKIG